MIVVLLFCIISLALASLPRSSLSVNNNNNNNNNNNKVTILANYDKYNTYNDDNNDDNDNIQYNNAMIQTYSNQYQQRSSSDYMNNANNNPNINTNQQSNIPPVLNPLLKQAPTASIVMLFLLLIWRSLASYELAGQFAPDSYLRLLAVTPSLTILLSNLTGFVVTIFKPINFKNHLKIILAINIVREWIELIYNILKIILSSSSAVVPREGIQS